MKRFAIITGLLSGFLFGVATPFSKLLLDGLNSFQLAGLLYLGAAIAMFPYIFRKNNNLTLLFHPGSRMKTLGIIFFESWGFSRADIVVFHNVLQYHEKKVRFNPEKSLHNTAKSA